MPELQSLGGDVRVLAIAEEDTSWLQERNVEVFRGDVRDPKTLLEPIRGVDTVFHLAGLMGVWRPMADYRAVNVQGTVNVALAALGAGVRRMVHVSSWTVYGMGLRSPAREDAPLRPFAEPYSVTKVESEAVIRRLVASRGLQAIIVRPDTFYGPGDRVHFERMADRLKNGTALVIGSGRNVLPFMYVSDVARGLVLASQATRAVGQVYNIAGDRPITQEQMLRAIADAIGARPARLHVPYLLMFAGASAAEGASALLMPRRKPPVTRLAVNIFGTSNPHDAEKARTELGFQPKVSLEEGVRLTAEWYLGRRAESSASPSTAGVESRA